MGSGASMARKMETDRRQFDEQIKEMSERLCKREEEHAAEATKQSTENAALKETVKQLRHDLVEKHELWRQEREKNVSLTFGHLPLAVLETAAGVSARGAETTPAMLLQHAPVLSQTHPQALIACCNVVGYHKMLSKMTANEAISLTDRLHILVDRAFQSANMTVLDKSADCCMAISGVMTTDYPVADKTRSRTPVITSATPDSGIGYLPMQRQATPDADVHFRRQLLPGAIDDEDCGGHLTAPPLGGSTEPGQQYSELPSRSRLVDSAAEMAHASLALMSSTVGVSLPAAAKHNQLQLRIAMHAGTLHTGVAGVTQHTTGLPPDQLQHCIPVPRLQVFGSAYSEVVKLRDTSLALQIRVSQQFRKLLLASGQRFVLEQCPDFPMTTTQDSAPLAHTYWLVGMETMDVHLPPLDRAVSLSHYDDF